MTDKPTPQENLRLWPGIVAVVLQWLLWLVVPKVVPGNMAGYIGAIGGLLGGLVVVVWWVFFSRAPRIERWGALVMMMVALLVTRQLLHESIATGGMGVLFFVYAVPVLCLALVVWAVATRNLSGRSRLATMAATILLACAIWTLLRTDGVSATGSDFAWRWSRTPEERLLAQAGDEPMVPVSAAATMGEEPEWSGFRGTQRNGIVPGVRIDTDWATSPPVELWRQPIGPGWSSFAVQGDLIYTQEQRGDDEIVSCYSATTGEPVWRHRDAARFWESNAGAGPRGTPTLHQGRVIALGATGILNVLDATDGNVIWSRNAAADTEAEVPYWGFSSSPLVVNDVVIVAVAGQLAAYDLDTGEPSWSGPKGGDGYSSPHLMTIDGVQQVLLLSAAGTTSVVPADGQVLWEHPWPGYPIVQPAQTANGDVLISASEGSGIRRIAVTEEAAGWTIEERWTSVRLKPYFNDYVVHDGHAFGFDGSILACIDLENGERQWKGGRYGQGQLILLPDQHLLLVLSEKGELAVVGATPSGFEELARLPALEGKTWNHPVLIDDLLLIRNGQEMVAFRLKLVSG